METDTKTPEFLSVESEYAVLRPTGEYSLEETVTMVSSAILYCREHEIEGLLVDVREVFGFVQPSVVDRYWFARKWAGEAASEVVLSFVQRPEMIDPEKIGVTISSNAGLLANVFEKEEEARAWLNTNVRTVIKT